MEKIDEDRLAAYHLRRAVRSMRRRRKQGGDLAPIGVDVRMSMEEAIEHLATALDARLNPKGVHAFLEGAQRKVSLAIDGMSHRIK